jgi:exo-beta-1,3-glucanase (GH17 family)
MRTWPLFFLLLITLIPLDGAAAAAGKHRKKTPSTHNTALQCVAFSPYVDKLNPNYGPHPAPELIDKLLDKLLKETPYRCIMTYGVLNGLDYTFKAAKTRNMKVIAIIWLDDDPAVNKQSIAKGIEVIKAFPETIVKISCGSELRTRHSPTMDGEIHQCIDGLRAAGIKQPITTIDTWWEWCNRNTKCQQTSFAGKVDWIGINVFPWWENKHAGVHTCTKAEQAADFHIARMEEIRKTYPGKEVMLTEFGWPFGPEGGTEANIHSGEKCGVANRKNQLTVIQSTFRKLAQKGWSGTVFEAFSEFWKPEDEGHFGSYWGICSGKPPYDCAKGLK